MDETRRRSAGVAVERNSARYGNVTATPAVTLVARVDADVSVASGDVAASARGGEQRAAVVATVLDLYGQRVASESTGVVVVDHDDCNATVSGNVAVFAEGRAALGELVVTKAPGATVELVVSSYIT